MHQNKQNYTPVVTFKILQLKSDQLYIIGPLRTVSRKIYGVIINKMCLQNRNFWNVPVIAAAMLLRIVEVCLLFTGHTITLLSTLT